MVESKRLWLVLSLSLDKMQDRIHNQGALAIPHTFQKFTHCDLILSDSGKLEREAVFAVFLHDGYRPACRAAFASI